MAPTSAAVLERSDRIPVAILREEGSNGDREMAAAFHLAGFETWDVTTSDLLAGIGDRLLDLFAAAGEGPLTEALQRRNLAALAKEYGDHQLESGSRRRFVKAAVAMLYEQAREAERVLGMQDIRTLAGSAGPGVYAELDGEELF